MMKKYISILILLFSINSYSKTIDEYIQLSTHYYFNGTYSKALEYYKEALRMQKVEKKYSDIIHSYNNIALIYNLMGDYSNSLIFYKKSISLAKKILGDNNLDIATSYSNIGAVYRTIGDYPKALKNFNKSLFITKKISKEHPDTANTYNHIGELYYFMGNYLTALDYYKKSLSININILGKNNIDTGLSYNNIGNLYGTIGEYKKSLYYHKKSLSIDKKILGEIHPYTATAYNNISMVYRLIQNYPKALDFCKKSLYIREKMLGKKHYYTAVSYRSLSSIYYSLENYLMALKFSQKALVIKKEIFDKNHPSIADSYMNIAEIYLIKKDYKKCYLYSKLSFDIFMKNRYKNFEILDNLQKQYYLKSESPISNILNSTYQYILNLKDKNILIYNIFNNWLNYKRTIFDTENSLKILYAQTKYKNIKLKIDELYHAQKKLARLYQTVPKDNKKLNWYKKSIKETRENISKLEILLSSKSSKLYTQNIDYKQISKHLKQNELYIDFAKTEIGYYFVFTLDKTNKITFKRFDLNETMAINDTIKAIHKEDKFRIDKAHKNYSKLYDLIFKKIDIKNKTSLIISPDGELNKIPFEALYDGEKYLIQKLNIRYIPSGKEFVKLYQHNDKSNNIITVFANPSFGLNADERKESQLKGSTIEFLYNKTNKGKKNYFGTLTNQDEPKIIKKLYGKNAKIYLGKDATESNFFKIKSPKILHLSTHGFYLKDKSILNPMLKSGIALSGANNSIKNRKGDGIITALELSGMDLSHTELVVLSACETGVGEVENGEGVLGLSKAFMTAGVKYIVMSLWSVPTDATGKLMKRFYENLHRGYGYSKALREAKIWWIENKNSHPFFWSGFVGSGRG